ncbi:MAG: NAD-dependent protein deacetylase of SIR2 family, partial [uncultured Rubrobacteraceae bacterium]
AGFSSGAGRGPARGPPRGGVDRGRDLGRKRRPHFPGRAGRTLGAVRPAGTRNTGGFRARPRARLEVVRVAARACRKGAAQRRARRPGGARTRRAGLLPRHPERGRPAPGGRQRERRRVARQHPPQPLPGGGPNGGAGRGGPRPAPLPQLRLASPAGRGVVRGGTAGCRDRSGLGGGAFVRPLSQRRDLWARLSGGGLALRGPGERRDGRRDQPGAHAALGARGLLAAGKSGRGFAAARRRRFRL